MNEKTNFNILIETLVKDKKQRKIIDLIDENNTNDEIIEKLLKQR